MQTPSVMAKRWPMQLRGPEEKASTVEYISDSLKYEQNLNVVHTGVAWPMVRVCINEPLRFELCYIIAPIYR